MGRLKKISGLKWIDGLSEVSGYVSGLLIVLSMLIVCYGVVIRALGQSTTWQIELTTYLLIFVTFVGGAYGLKHDKHVNVDLLVNKLPKKARLCVKLIASLLCLVLVTVVGWAAFETWLMAFELGYRSGTAWNIPMIYPYAILPISMVLIGLQYVAIMLREGRDLAKGQDESEEQTDKEAREVQGL